jgi:hypothetical protein
MKQKIITTLIAALVITLIISVAIYYVLDSFGGNIFDSFSLGKLTTFFFAFFGIVFVALISPSAKK